MRGFSENHPSMIIGNLKIQLEETQREIQKYQKENRQLKADIKCLDYILQTKQLYKEPRYG